MKHIHGIWVKWMAGASLAATAYCVSILRNAWALVLLIAGASPATTECRLPFTVYRLLITIAIFLGAQIVNGQPYTVNVTVIVPPPYSPYLQDYLQYENKMVVQLQNLTSQQQSVKLIGSVEGDNGIALVTNENYLPATPINIPPNGIYRIPGSTRSRGFLDPDNLEFIGPENLKTKILKDGILPEGTYTLCIRAVDYDSGEPLSDEAPAGCTILDISYPTPPEPVLPECQSDLEQDLPFLQWTLPGGNIGGVQLQYDLYIIEWLEGSNPQDLVQLAVDYNAGNAIVRRNLLTPSYQYMVTDPKLKPGATYLWVVKVHDRSGRIQFENNGQSEVCSFVHRNGRGDGVILHHEGTQLEEIEIQQHRTVIRGKLNYKFPGSGGFFANNANAVPRSGIQTEEEPYVMNGGVAGNLDIVDNNVYAMANFNYIDGFPVDKDGSKPLKNIELRLFESWVIVDCDITYLPQNYTEHKPFFILPNDYRTPAGLGGGTNITVDVPGLTEGEDNMLNFSSSHYSPTYSQRLDIDRTDANGNFEFRFTQSAPGLMYGQYNGQASVTMTCERVVVPVEENDYVHPLEEQSNPAEIFWDQPSGINVLGEPAFNGQLPQQGNTSNRMGFIGPAPNQQPYEGISISGGKLYKVLRIEVVSDFYYSPDLIFWTQPGDTVTLPDQVSYVKSVDLDLLVRGGNWVHFPGYQKIQEGKPVSGIHVLMSREKTGLPASIPIEEGQGLRDYEGESGPMEDDDFNMVEELESIGYGAEELHDSVSVDLTNYAGMAYFKNLVAAHHYLLEGNSPDYNWLHYDVPLQTKLYQVFSTNYCRMNVGTNYNSFSNHKAINIRDTVTAYPLAPRVFGRVMTHADNAVPVNDVEVHLLKYSANGGYMNHTPTHTYPFGQFQFSNLPVSTTDTNDLKWRIRFMKAGFERLELPVDSANGMRRYVALRPGVQWFLGDVYINPLGHIGGFIKDEDGKPVPAVVRLEQGPYSQTHASHIPFGNTIFCGDVNATGDALNEETKLSDVELNNPLMNAEVAETQASRFTIPAQAGNVQFIVIPLSDQYFQDTCMIDVDMVDEDEIQELGYFILKERLHRPRFTIRSHEGEAVSARIYIDQHVRETDAHGRAAFRFASAETEFHVRIIPESATLVPIDTMLSIPVSKTYVNHTFILEEGRKIRVKVIADYSDSQNQPANPIPIEGAVVQTLLSSSEFGNAYIQCITGSDGICTLEGVPVHHPTVDVSAWKEDDDHLYIGKTIPVSTNRPLNPPVEIGLKVLSGISVKDIWGFPATITGFETRTNPNGTRDTLMQGAIIEVPENARFRTANADVQLPFAKRKFTYSGQRDDLNRKIYSPSAANVALLQHKIEVVLYDAFNVQLTARRTPNGMSHEYPLLEKNGQYGKIEGVVQTELSSFNTSHDFDGKFYLGRTPTDYIINVFQSGTQLYGSYTPPVEHNNPFAEPDPGPDDFYLLDINGNNQPRSHAFHVFEFPATSDSSKSFVSENAFYIHTVLHTDIDDISPRDLKLQVGKIVVTQDDISTLSNTNRLLDFQMGTYWEYKSTTPYYYSIELGGITANSGSIHTGAFTVPVNNIIIHPEEIFIHDINAMDYISLGGIKRLYLLEDVDGVLSPGWDSGWRMTFHKMNGEDVDHDGIIAVLDSLPLLMPQDEFNIHAITIDSERPNVDVNISGGVRPHNICDYDVVGMSTGEGYFELEGHALLGRTGMRVPDLPSSYMAVKYTKPGNKLIGEVTSEFAGDLTTGNKMRFVFDFSTGNKKRQSMSHKRFSAMGTLTVSGDNPQHKFRLKGILDVGYNKIDLHIIHEGMNQQGINFDSLDYINADQPIELGNAGRKLLVRDGIQHVNGDDWGDLAFDANMAGFTGVDADQDPMPFVANGAVTVNDEPIQVDGISFGIGELVMSYHFETQSLTGSLDIELPPPGLYLGPVSVEEIHADVLIDPNGFLFSAAIEGTLGGMFQTTLGMLIGAHTNVSDECIENTMQYAKNKTIPEILADHKLNGFFITGRVDLVNLDLGEVELGVFNYSGRAAVGIDARLWMDFESNGDYSFGFAALAFAGAKVEVTLIGLCPWEGIVGEICLAAELQLLIEGSIQGSGGEAVVTGKGCGSMSFSGSICKKEASITGWAELILSSRENDNEFDGGLGRGCTGGSSSEFSCAKHL